MTIKEKIKRLKQWRKAQKIARQNGAKKADFIEYDEYREALEASAETDANYLYIVVREDMTADVKKISI